jgi:hypothetical protein
LVSVEIKWKSQPVRAGWGSGGAWTGPPLGTGRAWRHRYDWDQAAGAFYVPG